MTQTTEMMEMIAKTKERLPDVEDPQLRRYLIIMHLNIRAKTKASSDTNILLSLYLIWLASNTSLIL